MDLGDLTGQAKDLLGEHADVVEDGIDKAADLADEKTGGKFTDQIDGAADQIKGLIPTDGE